MKITAISEQLKNNNRVNVFIEEEFCFACSKDDLLKFDLFKGKTLEEIEINKIKESDLSNKAFNKACDYISRRPHSEKELRDKLVKKGYELESIKITLEKLKKLNLLNDVDFARSFIHDRRIKKPKGKRSLLFELKLKGVHEEIIKNELAKITDELEEKDALSLIERKFIKNSDQVKAMRYLSGRGYSYDIITRVIERLQNKKFFD